MDVGVVNGVGSKEPRYLQIARDLATEIAAALCGRAADASRARAGIVDASLGSLEELVQFGRDAVREVTATEQVIVDPALAAATGLEAGAMWVRLTTIRRAPEGSTVAWSQVISRLRMPRPSPKPR